MAPPPRVLVAVAAFAAAVVPVDISAVGATAAAATATATATVDPDFIQYRDDGIDYTACLKDLVDADRNQDGTIRQNEYLAFVQSYRRHARSCTNETLDGLSLAQRAAFVALACRCQGLKGYGDDCCVGDNAHIITDGATIDSDAESRTQEQVFYLAAVCRVTDGTIDQATDCTASTNTEAAATAATTSSTTTQTAAEPTTTATTNTSAPEEGEVVADEIVGDKDNGTKNANDDDKAQTAATPSVCTSDLLRFASTEQQQEALRRFVAGGDIVNDNVVLLDVPRLSVDPNRPPVLCLENVRIPNSIDGISCRQYETFVPGNDDDANGAVSASSTASSVVSDMSTTAGNGTEPVATEGTSSNGPSDSNDNNNNAADDANDGGGEDEITVQCHAVLGIYAVADEKTSDCAANDGRGDSAPCYQCHCAGSRFDSGDAATTGTISDACGLSNDDAWGVTCPSVENGRYSMIDNIDEDGSSSSSSLVFPYEYSEYATFQFSICPSIYNICPVCQVGGDAAPFRIGLRWTTDLQRDCFSDRPFEIRSSSAATSTVMVGNSLYRAVSFVAAAAAAMILTPAMV